jgi:SAM-dependent methyltransferase
MTDMKILQRPKSTFRKINNLIHKSYLPQIILTAMDVGIFDMLHEHPMSASEISERLALTPTATQALMDVLDASGYVEKKENRYRSAQISRDFFDTASPFFQGAYMKKALGLKMPDKGAHILRNGPPVFDRSEFCDKNVLEHFGQLAKAGLIQDVVDFTVSLPEFKDMTWACDIAGNYGYFAMGLLDANPRLKAYVYDLPEVAELAKEMIFAAGYSDRLTPLGFDLNAGDAFGQGYDLVLASNCLHMVEDHARLERFFRLINQSLNPGGIFISNHMTMDNATGDDYLTQAIKEYHVRLAGISTHHISGDKLKSVLEGSGFGKFTVQSGQQAGFFNTMLLAARKLRAV